MLRNTDDAIRSGEWSGLCDTGKHGLDYRGQRCDLCPTIAAIYIDRRGPYWNRPDIDAWDEERDARKYNGTLPVLAHPPCERWGRYWGGGPSAKVKRKLGDDGGCFAHALAMVCRNGGVIEHPEASHAWARFGIGRPPKTGGWIGAFATTAPGLGSWTCCVEQGHYGHPARKATWLLYVGRTPPPELIWGKSNGIRLELPARNRSSDCRRCRTS